MQSEGTPTPTPAEVERLLARTDKLISERRTCQILQGTELEAATDAGAGASTPARLTDSLKTPSEGPPVFTRENDAQPFEPVPPT